MENKNDLEKTLKISLRKTSTARVEHLLFICTCWMLIVSLLVFLFDFSRIIPLFKILGALPFIFHFLAIGGALFLTITYVYCFYNNSKYITHWCFLEVIFWTLHTFFALLIGPLLLTSGFCTIFAINSYLCYSNNKFIFKLDD